MAAIDADAFLLPLFDDSPKRATLAEEKPSRSILGRRPTSTRPSQSLTELLDVIPSEDEKNPEETNDPAQTQTKESDDTLYDAPRKKIKTRQNRIGRPRDSMPGYRRNRWGGRGRGGRFRYRGNNMNNNVGAKHLDRGSSASAYYGTSASAHPDGDDGAANESALLSEMTKKEREGLAERVGDIGALSELAVPICSGHSKPCKRAVTKKGKNKGRPFFVCAHERRFDQCDFFAWADAPTAVVTADDYGGFAAIAGEDFVVPPAVVEDPENADVDAVAKQHFDIDELRPQQRRAAELLRDGNSVLTILPTGGGKSLVYQLFAGITPGLVLVITPLVSLMRDQELRMPDCLPCACLRGGQSLSVVEDIERRIQKGEVKVLLVSPERLFAPRFRALIRAAGDDFFSAIVIDEAHCISEWSHNFRTSYLRLSLGIKQVFNKSPRVLALTATATTPTEKSICELLDIDAAHVVRASTRRDNLTLGVTQVRGNSADAKPHELVRVLSMEPYATVLRAGLDEPTKAKKKNEGWADGAKGITKRRRGRKSDAGSVLIYVSKQRECAAVCNFLKSSNLRFGRTIAMYHAGLSSYDRDKTQKEFQEGRVCVLVATVAFGMGLNVANVRAVIHYDAPFSLESYAQEVGRAGRDGRSSVCHALVSTADKQVLVSRAHSDGVEPSTVRKFVVALGTSRRAAHDDADIVLMHVAYSVLEGVHDMYAEGAETVVALLERRVEGVELLSSGHSRLVVQFFTHTPDVLLREPHADNLSAHETRTLRMIVDNAKVKNGIYELDLPKVGLLEEEAVRGLRKLARSGALKTELRERALRVRCSVAAADILVADAPKLATAAAEVLARIEEVRVAKARAVCAAFGRAEACLTACEQSEQLHDALERYFDGVVVEDEVEEVKNVRIRGAIDAVLGSKAYSRKAPRTPREVARILHGIQSAAFTAKSWYACGQWRKWTHVPFEAVKKATADVIRERLQRAKG